MSGLRDFITGSDACNPDGAGPSNAVSGLASTLLGTQSKTRSRLHEFANGAGPSSAALPSADFSTSGTVERLAGGPSGASVLPFDPAFQEFERIYNEGLGQGPVPGRGPAVAPSQYAMPHAHGPAPSRIASGPSLVFSALHNFLQNGRMRAPFQPRGLASAPAPLTVHEKIRLRDRSTILARHLYADHGDAFADQQVGALLHSLGINAHELPAQVNNVDHGAWDAVWNQQTAAPPDPWVARAQAQEAAGAGGTGAVWANQFEGPHSDTLRDAPAGVAPAAWAAEFERRQQPPGAQRAWAEEFSGVRSSEVADGDWAAEFANGAAGTAGEWAQEFEGAQAGGTADAEGAAREHSRRMMDVLARDPDARFEKSQFMQFLSKMSQGEVTFQGGRLMDKAAAATGNAWAAEFAAQEAVAGAPAGGGLQEVGAEQFAQGSDAGAWAEDFQRLQEQQDVFDDAWAQVGQQAAPAARPAAAGLATEYVFAADNPYDGQQDALERARTAFAAGSLIEACLALEAVVKADPGNTEAWRLLGTAHAENDDDRQAIAAMARALAAQPDSLDVMLSLGVSHVNELDEGQAVGYLMSWLAAHPTHRTAAADATPRDSSQMLTAARAAFERAATASPADSEVQTALGVIAHLAGDFPRAAAAFEAALRLRPEDYSLWNKLGATLANSNRSEDAKGAYVEALKRKPNYMRAWANLGISHANLGQYSDAANFYVKALQLNGGGASVWGYLKTALVLMGRMDLMADVEARSLSALQQALGVAGQAAAGKGAP